ncbi:Trehalose-regulated TonB-dependent outer membrane receptor [Alteromonas sp. 38]|uniref:TonB-dependent receptor n=1 Tax=Alteromonas TaxID=226 RepID=UPI0012F28F9D|nr:MULTISPECIES: TonB-dependent receptor [Alteromonas]CAD5254270.1 Trehalose-regulated TonB-dependent outer membrane receptor [Alteromonas sp. 154]VXB04995.1 Trehalose-regulated TonB-dependent outer membrane receptor [Alteromonas sp. 38]
MKTLFTKGMLATAISLALTQTAFAQEETKQATAENTEVIVVSGTPGGAGIRKIDASFAVTNIDASDIEKFAPKSTADLFKAIPGVWVESSGGESGANVFVRGFPGGGDAPFLTIALEGSPIYPASTLSFLENSQMFRIDDTIEMVEGLRGGPNPVVSNGQPGLTTNFRLKRGGEDSEASVKYTVSDYGLNRVDLVLSGALADDLYYMVGGYVKSSDGIRDAGFSSEEGNQFTVNLTKIFDKGELNLYTRQTDDHGTWYLPTPLNVEGIDANYTQIGPLNRQATINYGPDNTAESFDFGDGRGWDGHVSGGSLKLELGGGWHLVDRFNLTKGEANTFGLVPDGSAVTVADVADNGESATGAVTGNTYDADTPIQQIGRWVVLKDVESFTNDLAVSKSWDNFDTSFGIYSATTKAEDWWSIGNQAYYVLVPGGEMLDGIACNSSEEGCGWGYDINSVGDASTFALYATSTWYATEDLSIDLGLRRENHEVSYSVDEGLDGVITKALEYDENKTSWTLGANYALNDFSGVFVRMNRGYKMPYFDDFRDNWGAYTGGNDLIKEVTQGELGYKFMNDDIQFFATAFANEVQGDTFVRRPGAPAEILTNEAYGIEFDGKYSHDSGFSLSLNATFQETEITASATNEGNEAQRQPGWQVRMTPSYGFDVGDMYATVYGTFSAVDDRFGDNENTVVLEGYEKVDVGMTLEPTDALRVQLSIDNLTDEQGITEGDPRNPDSPNGRYIMPRSMKLSVSYLFF